MTSFAQWLTEIGLDSYASVFSENKIDFDVIRSLSEADLRELGLAIGDRKRLLQALASQDEPGIRAAGAVSTDSEIPVTTAVSDASAGERRQLTVMFCDLVGSTALSEKLDPEELRSLLHDYRTRCGDVIARYEGFVARYVGDGILTYFGWPKAHEDDAERSIRTALEIIPAIKRIVEYETLSVRIGIATGAVVVGEQAGVGDQSKLAVGSTPNLAARLQGVAAADEIVIAPSTRRLIGDGYELSDLGDLILKGILDPVRAFKVLGPRRVESRFEASHARQLTPLVGRDSEIALLLDRWERAKTDEGQAVMLSAEAGIGKSRITRALREHIASDPHIALHYQCSPFHNNSAFYPIIDQFERAAEFNSGDTADQKLVKMEALLGKADPNVAEVAPLYAAMLSIPTENYPDLRLSPQQQKERTIAAQVAQVIGLASRLPVVMVLEDAHWADPSTLETFASVLEQIDSARLLLIITYRPEFTPPWHGQSRVTALSLARMSRKDTATIAEQVSGKPLPPEVLDQILAKTDGVPLFVEELTKVVLESRLLADAGDHYSVTAPLPPLAIPSSLHDSLMARLDRLGPAKELIQLGAVIGREFSHKLIAALSSLPAPQLEIALNQLVTSELVFKRGTAPNTVYVFKHALVQDAAYESTLRSRRQQLHADIANSLEKDIQRAQSDPGVLAKHFDRAGLSAKAIQWYMQAALQAKSQFANIEALRYLECALKLLATAQPDDAHVTQRIDVNTEIGMLLMMLEGYHSQRALEYITEAEKLSRNTDDVERRFRMLTGIIVSFRWRRLESNHFSEELIAIAKQTGDRVHRIYAHAVRGESLMFAGRYQGALVEFEQVQMLYDERIDAALVFQYGNDPGVLSLVNLAYMQWETGQFDIALSTSERFIRLSHQLGHPYAQGFAYSWTSDLAYYMWLPDRARRYADLGVEFCRKHGFSLMQALCSFHRGWVRAKEEHYDEAIEQMTHALIRYREGGSAAVFVSRMIAQLASVYGMANRCEEGLRVLESSPDRSPGNRRVRFPEISRIEGELHLNKPDPDPKLAEQLNDPRQSRGLSFVSPSKGRSAGAA